MTPEHAARLDKILADEGIDDADERAKLIAYAAKVHDMMDSVALVAPEDIVGIVSEDEHEMIRLAAERWWPHLEFAAKYGDETPEQ